jgi:hypothetical protein
MSDDLDKSMRKLAAELVELDKLSDEQRAAVKAHNNLLDRHLGQVSDDLIKARFKLFAQFMDAGSRGEGLRAWVKAHPDLLDPRFDQPLKDWLRSVAEAEETSAAEALGGYVKLREDCRDCGVDAAFDRQDWAYKEPEKARTLRLIGSEGEAAQAVYARTRSLQALENVMKISDRALKAAEDVGAPWLLRTNYAIIRSTAHLRWYRVKHERADSELALTTLDTVIGQLPRTSGLRLSCLVNAGLGWADRAVHEESQAALDQAIKRYGQVMSDYQGTGRTDAEVVKALGILSRLLWNRYRISGDARDLREAGRVCEAWLAFEPNIDPKEDVWVVQLAAALDRQRTGS